MDDLFNLRQLSLILLLNLLGTYQNLRNHEPLIASGSPARSSVEL